MYADDQDEEVEEEEEFHEVEEEKHKTSQDAVNDSNSNHALAPGKATSSAPTPSPDVDWANIMLRDKSEVSDQPSSAEIPSGDPPLSPKAALDSQNTVRSNDDSIMNNIIKDTQDKLKIVDESCDSIDQSNPKDGNLNNVDTVESAAKLDTAATRDKVEKDLNHLEPDQQRAQESSHVLPDDKCTPDSSELTDPPPQSHVEQIQIVSQDSQHEPSDQDSVPKHQPTSEQRSSQEHQEHSESLDPIEPRISDEKPIAEGETLKSDLSVGAVSESNPDQKDSNEIADDEKKSDVAVTDEKKSDEAEKKELDLDEDVKNPQYIPKKGVFYEHDDRSHDAEEKKASTMTQKEGDAVETKDTIVNKRTPSQDKQAENRRTTRKQRTDADRWNHDLFRGEKQKPKSKSELVNAYGYDIRQERGSRGQHSDRQPRSGNNSNSDRTSTTQDGQRSRQSKDGRVQRQNQPSTRSRERRARRQNVSKINPQQQRSDGSSLIADGKREVTSNRPARNDVKDSREVADEKLTAPPPSAPMTNNRREQEVAQANRNPRNDSRGRRKTSRDRPANNEERLPSANAVMPPITTWSNEDMMKAEAFGKKSPSRSQNTNTTTATGSNSNAHRDRSSDLWQQSQQNKTIYQDRPPRNQDESRQQSYNSRGRYQERGDENHRPAHYLPRNQYHDRANQNQDWHRVNNFSQYGKPNDYIVKTQTFENSRLSQANMSRSSNNRDLREVINERRMQGQQNFQNKVHHNVEHQRSLNQGQIFHQQYAQSHMVMQQHHMAHNQQQSPQMHMMQAQQALPSQHHQQSQQQTPRHIQIPASSQQQSSSQTQPQANTQTPQPQLQNHRQQPATTQAQSPQGSTRQTALNSTTTDCGSQDSARVSGSSGSTDPANSRPIIKTDTYTGNMHSHQQHVAQHSQGHRSIGGPLTQQNPAPATSHMVPTHMSTGAQPQYYTPTPGSRDPTAGATAVATAYHGYIPGGHPVMDATRYHMASQQLTDHGYMTTPSQTSDVSGGVLHQQSMYPDTSAGGAVANSTFLAQHPGSTISPNTNIPVTGAGPQLPPVPYIQHSQYPPPPYSNPYSQPQHNQGPPQSGHAYPPYWTYI